MIEVYKACFAFKFMYSLMWISRWSSQHEQIYAECQFFKFYLEYLINSKSQHYDKSKSDIIKVQELKSPLTV